MLEDLSRNLRKIRRDKDLTQSQIALLVGIRQPEVSAYERGLRPPLALVDKFARALCVSPDELLRGAGE